MNLVRTRNDRDVLLSTAVASSMVFIDSTAVNTVLPAIQRRLDTALTDAQFITVLAIGLGLLVAPLTTIAVNVAGEGKSGIAASLNNAVVDVGALFTIAIAGLLLVPIYRRQLIAGLAALLPSDAVTAIAAQASKLANITLPPGLSADLNDAVAISVKAALAESLGMVITIGGIGGFIAAAVTALMVRPRTVAPQS